MLKRTVQLLSVTIFIMVIVIFIAGIIPIRTPVLPSSPDPAEDMVYADGNPCGNHLPAELFSSKVDEEGKTAVTVNSQLMRRPLLIKSVGGQGNQFTGA